MVTEYGGAPVDGGTIPALIFNEVINAVDAAEAPMRRPGQTPSTSGTKATARDPHCSHRPRASQLAAGPALAVAAASRPQGQQGQAPSQTPPSTGGGGGWRHQRRHRQRRGRRLAAARRSAQRPRQVLAARRAEAPREARRRGVIPMRGPVATRDGAPAVVTVAELERRLGRAAPGSAPARSPAPRSACRAPSRARAPDHGARRRRHLLDPPARLQRPDQHRGRARPRARRRS